MKLNTMLTVFLLFSSFCSVLSHPSRPLNERTTELALQEAWLLIDDQNQSKQNLPDMMRRKIVAKSVFIAPTFKPEELPPCADGYTSDSMGRCVKIIQLDPDEHLKFLFQKLVGNFGASSDNQEESMPTSGPVQFSIDLDLTKNSQEESDDSLKSTDVALVFTTSNMKPAQRGDERVQDDQTKIATGNLNLSFVPAPTNGSFDPDKINVKNEEKNSGDTETTTTTDSITEATTEPVFSTTLSFGDETPTTPPETTPQTESSESTTFLTETDENHHGHALFFKVPPPPVQNPKSTPKLGSRIKFEDETMNNDQPETQDSTNANDGSSRVTFKDEYSSDLGDLMTSENVRHPSHRIRFPDERDQPLYLENSGKDSGSFYQFKRPQRQNQKPNLLQSNQRRPESASDRLQPDSKFAFNHRNRDKNFWQAPSSWRESSPKKALVLRFSRMPGQGNFTLSDINRRRSEPLFRQVRIEDLSYIFGHRRKRSNR